MRVTIKRKYVVELDETEVALLKPGLKAIANSNDPREAVKETAKQLADSLDWALESEVPF